MHKSLRRRNLPVRHPNRGDEKHVGKCEISGRNMKGKKGEREKERERRHNFMDEGEKKGVRFIGVEIRERFFISISSTGTIFLRKKDICIGLATK